MSHGSSASRRPRSCSQSYIKDAVRVLKILLRQAVERDVIADYPIKTKVPREKEVPLRLELKLEERTRFYAAFEDKAAFAAILRPGSDERELRIGATVRRRDARAKQTAKAIELK